MVGLDSAGKTTILYKLKLGEVVVTIPTIGKYWFFHLVIDLPCAARIQRGNCSIQRLFFHRVGCWRSG
jgi:hypothetical protein